MKISDNNIENIFNININIQGVFSNNIEQDIVNVVVGLLNQQGVVAGGATLKDQLMALAQKSDDKDLNLDIPVGSAGSSFNFDGLASKIQEAIANKSSGESSEKQAENENSTGDMQAKAKDLIQKYIASNPQLKL